MTKEKNTKLSDVLQELKSDYLEALPKKMKRLQTLTLEENWSDLAEEYHKLKGTGKTYGFPEISIVCEQLERLALHKQGQKRTLFDEALSLLERIYQAYQLRQSYDLKQDSFAQSLLALKSK